MLLLIHTDKRVDRLLYQRWYIVLTSSISSSTREPGVSKHDKHRIKGRQVQVLKSSPTGKLLTRQTPVSLSSSVGIPRQSRSDKTSTHYYIQLRAFNYNHPITPTTTVLNAPSTSLRDLYVSTLTAPPISGLSGGHPLASLASQQQRLLELSRFGLGRHYDLAQHILTQQGAVTKFLGEFYEHSGVTCLECEIEVPRHTNTQKHIYTDVYARLCINKEHV
ncbi:hypothetical protein RUM43_014307 [Polyplax serrata]|uniref:Uncharacterized protein n=1 Tax=Polyplax serrata TaxID=468196 RepID=A0AAN8NX60_POLSC